MSLTWQLLLLAGFVLAAILAYNHWQDRRSRQQADRLFSRPSEAPVPRAETEKADAPWSLETSDIADEPLIALQTEWDEPQSSSLPVTEPGLNDLLQTPKPEIEALPIEQIESPLDAEIEQVARIRFTRPCGPAFNALLERLRAIGRPVRVLAHYTGRGWESLSGSAGSEYVLADIGLLLADRSGVATSEQLEDFSRLLYRFAADQGGAVSCADGHEAATRAIELDRFCIGVDVVIGFNVVAPHGQPFRGEAIHRLATEAGLIHQSAGYYALLDEEGSTLFTLVNQEKEPIPFQGQGLKTHGVRLLFDLPRVKEGGDVFDRMSVLADRLADNLLAGLVDDAGRPLNAASLHAQREKLLDFYRRMNARDIPPGGERAQRLFA